MGVLHERDAGTTGVFGRRVFIKGLAATGALVGGLAATGPALAGETAAARPDGRRPTPFSQGWTSQPGLFVDDVSLPDGFTYDVVASYRDPIGGGDPHGRIRRLAEEGGDPTADTFAWADMAVGGPDPAQLRGLSSPDNLVFDRLGNLWMVTDISSGSLNDHPQAPTATTATTASS